MSDTNTVTECKVCGFTYCADLAEDCRQHNRKHRAAVSAQVALAGVGPCPLPLSYRQREELKRERHLVKWSHFARSLEAMNYDLKRHPSWGEYQRTYPKNGSSYAVALDDPRKALQ